MNLGCPNNQCSFHLKSDSVVRDGLYFRKDDSRYVQRFKCMECFKKFSSVTNTLECGQKKRRVNNSLFKLLASGISMRRAALILNIHRVTVHRKLIYLANKAQKSHADFLLEMQKYQVTHLQFDDLITIEHTKLKPLSVTLAVDAKRRLILGCSISQIPAFGHLAKLSRKKYGYRKSYHREKMHALFDQIKDTVKPTALIESDEHKLYPEVVRTYFPNSEYKQYKGGRGCVAGQGELKKLHYDPLFILNHTCAMLRANINRLVRRTWCTTKDPAMLKRHLDIHIAFHNQVLVK